MTAATLLILVACANITLTAVVARVKLRRRRDGTRLADSPERRRYLIAASQEQSWRNGQQ